MPKTRKYSKRTLGRLGRLDDELDFARRGKPLPKGHVPKPMYDSSVGYALRDFGAKNLSELTERMRAEIRLYRNLYGTHTLPNGEKYEIIHRQSMTWPDGYVTYDGTLFRWPAGENGKAIACVSLNDMLGKNREDEEAEAERNVEAELAKPRIRHIDIEYIQGIKGKKTRDVMTQSKDRLGMPWHDVFIGHIVRAFKPMHDQGMRLRLLVPKAEKKSRKGERMVRLHKTVRDRFFNRRGKLDSRIIGDRWVDVDECYLNPDRERVKELWGLK